MDTNSANNSDLSLYEINQVVQKWRGDGDSLLRMTEKGSYLLFGDNGLLLYALIPRESRGY